MTLATSVLARIKGEILDGAISPGAKINLDRMRADYGVSLSPLREALSQLVAQRLVETDQNRGFRATPVSKANLREIVWLRMTLEARALRQSIASGDDAWEANVVATLHRLEKLSYLRGSKHKQANEDWEYWHREFHNAIIAACGAPVLVQFCNSLHDQADRYRRTFLRVIKQTRNSHEEHRAIAAAAVKRDAKAACRLIEEHIERTGRDILAAMPGK